MESKYRIGDSAYLKEPAKGYRYVEITDYDLDRYVVKTSSGWEFTVYEDELEDNWYDAKNSRLRKQNW